VQATTVCVATRWRRLYNGMVAAAAWHVVSGERNGNLDNASAATPRRRRGVEAAWRDIGNGERGVANGSERFAGGLFAPCALHLHIFNDVNVFAKRRAMLSI